MKGLYMAGETQSPYVEVSLKKVKNKDTKEEGYINGSVTFQDSEGNLVTLSAFGQTTAKTTRAMAESYPIHLDVIGEASDSKNSKGSSTDLIPLDFPYRDILTSAGITSVGSIPGKKSTLMEIAGVDENMALEIAVARNDLANKEGSTVKPEEFEG
ncbi:MAG: hypothetical protein ACRDBG_17730 [Waterburya sp.]